MSTATAFRRLFAVLAVLALATFIAACGESGGGSGSDDKKSGTTDRAGDEAAKVQEITVNVGDETEPGAFDPAVVSYADSYSSKANPLFSGLYRIVGSDSKVEPHLAAGPPEVSDDGLTYTVEMRDDAKWSDGEPITADNVVAAVHHAMDPETGAYFAGFMTDIVGACEVLNGKDAKANCPDRELTDGKPESIGVTAVDEHTVEFKLVRQVPWFDQLLTLGTFHPQREDLLQKFGAEWTKPDNIVVSGPFKLTEYTAGKQWVVEKNDEYFAADDVKLDKITFTMIKEAGTAARQFEDKKVDTGMPNTMFDAAEVDKWKATDEYISVATTGIQYIWLNTKNKELTDPKVRQGIALAVDRKSIVENVTKRGDTPAATVVPDSVPGFDVWGEGAQEFLTSDGTPQVDTARELLKEGGWKEGTELDLYYSSDGGASQDIAELVQSNLADVGVTVNLKPTSGEVMSTPGYGIPPIDAKVDMQLQGWVADYLDAQNWYQLFECDGPFNNSNYCSDAYGELYEEALKTTDTDARYELYKQLEAKLSGPDGDMPAVPLYFQADATLVQPWIANFELTPSAQIYWDDVFVTSAKDE